MLWKDVAFTQDLGVPKLTGCSPVSSHLQVWSCSVFQFQNISPQMSSFPPHEIPGRPYASSHFCWSVNNEMQKPTYANWLCPSPSTQISSKDRELLGTDSGLETGTQLLQLLRKSHEMLHKMYFAWSKKCCPPTKQLPGCQQKGSNDLSLRVFKGSRNLWWPFASCSAYCLKSHVTCFMPSALPG